MTQQAKSIQCRNCGHDNLATASLCIVCDAPLSYTTRFQRKSHIPTGLLPTDEDSHQVEEETQPAIQRVTEFRAKPTPAQKTGAICPDCGNMNRVGDYFCMECGATLSSQPPTDSPADVTQQMKALTMSDIQAALAQQQAEAERAKEKQQSVTNPISKPELQIISEDNIPDGCFQFTDEMILRFTDVETGRYTEVIPTQNKPLLIGRSHKSLPIQPDVDLTPFLSEQHGVSRRHALIRLRDLRLEMQDLNSTNGTGINGFRFRAKETHEIRNGDIITLGRVSIQVAYLPKETKRSSSVTDKLEL